MPTQTNPAEWILEIVDTDFAKNHDEGLQKLKYITDAWNAHSLSRQSVATFANEKGGLELTATSRGAKMMQPLHLLHRNWIKSYRDLIAYWIRVAMYTCKPPA
jgi:hypothetical protein